MKIQHSCTYLHKMFAVCELKKVLDFCSSRKHICHLSFPATICMFWYFVETDHISFTTQEAITCSKSGTLGQFQKSWRSFEKIRGGNLGGHCWCQIFKKREKKKCIKSKMQIAVLKKKVLSQIQSQQFPHTRANLYYLETWTKSNNDSCTSLKNNLVWNFLCSLYRLSVYFAESNNTLAIFCSVK